MLKYRPEIDGMRAIAVICVILYHAQLEVFGQNFLVGGYIGVDIFFVISGYLISRILFSEHSQTGQINIVRFYERRARRILPMLLFVMILSAPFAFSILLPTEIVEYAKSLISSIFFFSNFFFYFATTEYGAQASLLKPFLHTWSLSVEEQFYFIFPIFAIIALRHLRTHFLTLLALVFLMSLIVSHMLATYDAPLNFYWPFSRFWELIAGSIVAYRELNRVDVKRGGGKFEYIFPWLGLILILTSLFFFGKETEHPGFITLLPVAGTCLLLSYQAKNKVLIFLLQNRVLGGVGLISYSAYLLHFPIFAFQRLHNTDPSNADKLTWVLTTFALSIVTYYVIERPARGTKLSLQKFIMLMTSSVFILVIFCCAIVWKDGWRERFAVDGLAENHILDDQFLKKQSWSFIEGKRAFDQDGRKKILTVGNSHSLNFSLPFMVDNELLKYFDVVNYRTLDTGIGFQLACFDAQQKEGNYIRDQFFKSDLYQNSEILIVSTRFSKGRCDGSNDSSGLDDLIGLRHFANQVKSDRKSILVFLNTAEFDIKVRDRITKYNIHRISSMKPTDFSDHVEKVNKLIFRGIRPTVHYYDENLTEGAFRKQLADTLGSLKIPYFPMNEIVCDYTEKKCFGLSSNGKKLVYGYAYFTVDGAKFFAKRMKSMGLLNFLKDL